MFHTPSPGKSWRPVVGKRPPCRPGLEALEDRCQPSAGALDPTFGTGGIVTTDLGSKNDGAYAVLVQPDGKILAGGYAGNSNGDFGLARYLPDGSPDLSFGSGGKVMTDFGAGESVYALALQADGKIVAGGYSTSTVPSTGQFDYAFALARYNPDGSLDTSFGGKGKSAGRVTTNLTDGSDQIHAVVIQPADGKILVAGGSAGDIALARYNANGSLDTSFGSGGIVRTDLGGGERAWAMALTPDGRNIVLAGSAYRNGQRDFLLARYNLDGSPDPSFGSGGHVVTSLGGTDDQANGVAVDPDGRIIAAGYVTRVVDPETGGVNSFIGLVRYDASGRLDDTFGTGGIVVTDLGPGDEEARAVAVDGNGRVLVAGIVTGTTSATALSSPNYDFAVVRYDSAGSLDPSFGSGGLARADTGGGERDEAYALTVQPDGKIVAAGRSGPGDGSMQFALIRLMGDPPPPTLSINDVHITEGNSGTVQATFTVTRSGDTTGTIHVNYATADGTATAHSDYEAAGGTLSFGPGETARTITVTVYGDTAVESDEAFFVNLSNASAGVAILDGQGLGTIVNDDSSKGGGKKLTAAAAGEGTGGETVTSRQAAPLLAEAVRRWGEAGLSHPRLGGVQVKVTNLPGTVLAQITGDVIWLDADAAGWGWFVDPTPRDDSEFITPGDQGEQERMDLLTALAHELGHLLGRGHEADGLMAETLAAGTRHVPGGDGYWADSAGALPGVVVPASASAWGDIASLASRRRR